MPIESILRTIEKIIPRPLYRLFQPAYHFSMSFLAALYHRFPSKNIRVIGVTGTKGKSSTAEFMNALLETSGERTALLGTIRFKIGDESRRNLYKMTMPGRFFVQRFLHDAVAAGCTSAVVEMTSEGARQFRQRFIDMDALIFTNLSPEHIESHGSYEKYREAKLSIARMLARSPKPHRFMIANSDDKEGGAFLAVPGVEPLPYSLNDAGDLSIDDMGSTFVWKGNELRVHLPGKFNVYNALAAATCARAFGIKNEDIARGLGGIRTIPGRAEEVSIGAKQGFRIVVDYAHTVDSLKSIYAAYPGRKIGVIGNTGGGRDKWKRPVMAKTAEEACEHVILTNEDPYDEDPTAILHEMEAGMEKNTHEIILDRREAIRRAIVLALGADGGTHKGATIVITGKGTDPYIMGPRGTKQKWDDRKVAREELQRAFG